MSQDALDTIADDGIADTLAHREAKTADWLPIPAPTQDQFLVGKAPTVLANLSKVRGSL